MNKTDADLVEQLRLSIKANSERIELIERGLLKALEESISDLHESIADLHDIIEEMIDEDDDEGDEWKNR